MKQAFSLVELSIVLVILGLLTGGILAGQNLIRAAELRSISTQLQSFQSATYTFRDKYFALPGDMANATAFWGDDATNCADAGVTDGSPGTCSGNGDGVLNVAISGPGSTGELFQFWKHLALAGLIEGTYSGLSGPGGNNDHEAGVNVPRGKIGNTAWGVYGYSAPFTASTNYFDGDYGNNLLLGGITTGNSRENQPFLKPEEAWNIDTKLDDSLPAQGKLVVRNRIDCTVDASTGTPLTNSAGDAAKLDALYNLSATSTECAILMKQFP